MTRALVGFRRVVLGGMLVAATVSVWAAGGPPTPSSATTVKITSPLGRMGTSGKVRIVAQIHAAPETSLKPIRFYVDSMLLGVDDDGPPYAVEWMDENPYERREIAVEVNRLVEARGEGSKLSPEKVGHRLRRLGLPTRRLSQAGNGLVMDKETMKQLQTLSGMYIGEGSPAITKPPLSASSSN